ncbi:hypothetical protein [Pseudoramibacter alactolyticus]|jgi:hypothetical protein|uniref:hypothetical protein n=1 Tax=Pseudoramibacter alactolyticus TaxID=113287 RepID=UPI002356D5AF|nr:hypothetical protein [Pseudoramibacter alactolyticus]MBM6967878.1 hypothetical protein [Pseudoramibacter alactolyticus]
MHNDNVHFEKDGDRGYLTLICRHAVKSGDGFIVAEMPASTRAQGILGPSGGGKCRQVQRMWEVSRKNLMAAPVF